MAYNPHAAGVASYSQAAELELFAGDKPARVEYKKTLLSGQVVTRGAVLGEITASKKVLLSLSAAADGSQAPAYILAHDADATGGDVEVVVYEAGCFNVNALTLGASHTVASIRAGLRDLNIILRTNLEGV